MQKKTKKMLCTLEEMKGDWLALDNAALHEVWEDHLDTTSQRAKLCQVLVYSLTIKNEQYYLLCKDYSQARRCSLAIESVFFSTTEVAHRLAEQCHYQIRVVSKSVLRLEGQHLRNKTQ